MSVLLHLLACLGTSAPVGPPPPVPADALEVSLVEEGVRVGAELVVPSEELHADPNEGLHKALIERLQEQPRVFLRASEDSPWMMVRKLVNSAQQAQVGALWLGTGDRAWPTPRTARGRWASPSCEPDSIEVVAVDTAFTIELYRGADGLWALGSARFRPVVVENGAHVAKSDLPPSCWKGVTCDLLAPETARAACAETTSPAPMRIQIAHDDGCLLPIARRPADLARWTEGLTELIARYGIASEHDVMLIPEATMPFGAVAAVLDAFAAHDQPSPTLGLPLIEGNDGPPLCTTSTRDRASLERAVGAWLGGQLSRR